MDYATQLFNQKIEPCTLTLEASKMKKLHALGKLVGHDYIFCNHEVVENLEQIPWTKTVEQPLVRDQLRSGTCYLQASLAQLETLFRRRHNIHTMENVKSKFIMYKESFQSKTPLFMVDGQVIGNSLKLSASYQLFWLKIDKGRDYFDDLKNACRKLIDTMEEREINIRTSISAHPRAALVYILDYEPIRQALEQYPGCDGGFFPLFLRSVARHGIATEDQCPTPKASLMTTGLQENLNLIWHSFAYEYIKRFAGLFNRSKNQGNILSDPTLVDVIQRAEKVAKRLLKYYLFDKPDQPLEVPDFKTDLHAVGWKPCLLDEIVQAHPSTNKGTLHKDYHICNTPGELACAILGLDVTVSKVDDVEERNRQFQQLFVTFINTSDNPKSDPIPVIMNPPQESNDPEPPQLFNYAPFVEVNYQTLKRVIKKSVDNEFAPWVAINASIGIYSGMGEGVADPLIHDAYNFYTETTADNLKDHETLTHIFKDVPSSDYFKVGWTTPNHAVLISQYGELGDNFKVGFLNSWGSVIGYGGIFVGSDQYCRYHLKEVVATREVAVAIVGEKVVKNAIYASLNTPKKTKTTPQTWTSNFKHKYLLNRNSLRWFTPPTSMTNTVKEHEDILSLLAKKVNI